VLYHPDKLSNPSPEQAALAQAFYVHLKNARDVLIDPAKRFAYERFGSDILECKNCITRLDFVNAGLRSMIPYYIGSVFVLVFTSLTGYLQTGKYWQYFTVAALFVFEAHTVTRAGFPAITSRVLDPILHLTAQRPPYLPYQAIIIARKIAVSIFIASGQIAPLLRSQKVEDTPQAQQQQMDQAWARVRSIDQEAQRLIQLETAPFLNDVQLERRLKAQLKAWLVRNEIQNEPGVHAAFQNAIHRRRMAEGPDMDDDR
jgi:hypothetical protein